jgi:hypothetical protein
MDEETPKATEPEMPMESAQTAPTTEGRRTQLRIVRENLDSLSNQIGAFRKRHDTSIKSLEKQVTSLRSQLSAQTLSKDVGSFRKSHDASSKKMEKQVVAIRKEMAELRSSIAKDAAKTRAKQEAMLAQILAKVKAKPKSGSSKKR